MTYIRTAFLVMVAMGAWEFALCGEPAAQSRPADGVIKVRIATRYQDGWWGVRDLAESAQTYKWTPWAIGYEYSDQKRPDRLQLAGLMAGKYDLAVIILPFEGGQDVNATLQSLREKKYSVSVVGWRVLGVAVHPTCPLAAIDQKTLRELAEGKIGTWQDLTGKDQKLKIVKDDRIFQSLQGISSLAALGKYHASFEIPKALKELADDPSSLGLMAVDERLASSGLKILPIRITDEKAPVEPSVQNVKDGKYPFYTCMAVIARPDAPLAAKDFARVLGGEHFADRLDTYESWSPRLDYALPGPEKPIVSTVKVAIQPTTMVGAVAVLPVENHSPHFLMAGQEHLSAWEQALTEGISADKRLAVVDRAELKRVLDEFQLALASGSKPKGPILSADVLVVSSLVTQHARAWLVIQALHAPTGSSLGEIRLPVDPAKPGEFDPALADQVKRWWPGVLVNLNAARTRPVWAIAFSAALSQPGAQGMGLLRTSLEAALAADDRVFLAQYRMLPQAQREKVMRLMGLAQSSGGRFTPAADYVVDLAESDATLHVSILNGRDLKVIASADLPTGQAADWLRQNVGTLGKPSSTRPASSSPADDGSAAQQAAVELRRGQNLRAQYEKLRAEAFNRYRAKGLSDYPDEDRKQLDNLLAAMERSFERAAQLDPANEKSSRESADAAWQKMHGQYDGMLQAQQRVVQYVDGFPGSSHARGMMERAISLEENLARYLEQSGVRDSSVAAVPRNLPGNKLIKEYRRSALKHLARYMERFIAVREQGGGDSWNSFGVMTELYEKTLDRYLRLDISEQEMEDVVSEYGRAVDSHPAVMKPLEFQKLRYCTIKADKQGYADVLAAMQKRWPDPKDVHWTLGKDEALQGLCELYKTDRRATHFYQWLRGKHAPCDLP